MSDDDVLELTDLERWVNDARALVSISQWLQDSPLCHDWQGDPQSITGVILAGHELGFGPMASLDCIRKVGRKQPKPALSAIAMRGLVQRAGHRIWPAEVSDTRVVMRGRRRGEEDQAPYESEWTLERARKLGLLVRDQWQQQPRAMLIARATAEVCRLTASDVLLGMSYAVEELHDLAPGTEPVKRVRRVRRANSPQQEPTFTADPPADPPAETSAETSTETGEPETVDDPREPEIEEAV
jgi:hypothetical protein